MSDILVRRLLVDLQAPIARHWNGGDAFRTALFNALSFSFPAGEQYFIDAVKRAQPALDAEQQAAFAADIKGFIGQEATHRRIHQLFNEQLERQGLVNRWAARIERRKLAMDAVGPRNWLAVTAATEHFTAVLAEYLLTQPAALQGAEPRLRDLWLWHSSEESEHRSVAFDIYRALGGNELWRRRIFTAVTINFVMDLTRQVLNNLWHDGTWWHWSTWTSAARALFGRDGVVTFVLPQWRRYRAADFHPSQGDGAPGVQWLRANSALAPTLSSSQVPA